MFNAIDHSFWKSIKDSKENDSQLFYSKADRVRVLVFGVIQIICTSAVLGCLYILGRLSICPKYFNKKFSSDVKGAEILIEFDILRSSEN